MARRDFSGKVILITGAAGGLGAALCHQFAAAGAHIAAMDLDATRLQDLVATLPTGWAYVPGSTTITFSSNWSMYFFNSNPKITAGMNAMISRR